MKEMEEKILREGKVLPGHILKVGSFLNQQVDIAFMVEMAREIARRFADMKVDKVMTVEASGIPFATLIAAEMGAREVIVKKHASANQSKEVYAAEVASYTHGNTYMASVAKEYILPGERFLLVDDFLATGNALKGMVEILKQAGAEAVGCAIAVEKGFQKGGDALREAGFKVESLAVVDEMGDDSILFRAEY